MKKIERLELWEEGIYTLTKSEALDILKKENITESEQVFLRWCRQGKIDSVRVVSSRIEDRGVFVNPQSLNAFITAKNPTDVDDLYIKISQLEYENHELKARIAFLEEKYEKKTKNKSAKS